MNKKKIKHKAPLIFISIGVISISFSILMKIQGVAFSQENITTNKSMMPWTVKCENEIEYNLVKDYLEKFRDSYNNGPIHKRKLASP